MAHLSRSLAMHVATRHGIVTHDQLLADGLTVASIRNQRESGLLESLHKGVYRLTTHPDTFESRCLAACEANPALTISGPSGGRLWGLRLMPAISEIDALINHGDFQGLRGIRARRSNNIIPEDVTVRPDGIRVVAPHRLWFDLASFLPVDRFESVTEQILDRHCGMATLWRVLRRLGGRGRRGAARAYEVLSSRPDWQRPADSDLEFRVLRALEHRGLVLVRQFPLRLRTGQVIHLDGADPAGRWGLEVDHRTWHGGRFERERDAARDRQAGLLGWHVERSTDEALGAGFDVEIDRLLQSQRTDRHS
jgi:hypothetical protein